MKKKIIISMIATMVLVVGGSMAIYANAETPSPDDLLSSGRIELDMDNDGTSEAIFDAKDLENIATSVETGKSTLAASLNAYPFQNVLDLDTFDNLSASIDTLTDVPDIYYYDKATEGNDCARYMLIDGSYYPCNQYGVQISEEPLAGTITVVAKDDTTEAGEGETLLVKYDAASDVNLSAGSAGFVDKTFVLGSGADNISYRNSGYAEGYMDGMATSNNNAQISYTYHYHKDSCYTKYCSGNCNSCGKAGNTYPEGKQPTVCPVCGSSFTWTTFYTQNVLTCGYTNGQILSATIVFN